MDWSASTGNVEMLDDDDDGKVAVRSPREGESVAGELCRSDESFELFNVDVDCSASDVGRRVVGISVVIHDGAMEKLRRCFPSPTKITGLLVLRLLS